MTPGVDLNWSGECDLMKSPPMSDWQTCAANCKQIPECIYWTFNTYTGACILKSCDEPYDETVSYAISGTRDCA